MHDAHTHIQEEKTLQYLQDNHLKCIVNACNEDEYIFLKKRQYSGMYISCGIHPWYVGQIKDFVYLGDFLGEIGLDQPWCDTPFELQKEIFIQQLRLINKPTILHTKGYEKEVLDIIRQFPRKYLVHWYSCKEYIDDYIALDCFFSVGPSVGMDECVNEVVRKVPLNRIVLETDGMDAVLWALGENKDYLEVLENSTKKVAEIKNRPYDEVKLILNKNFEALTCI